MWYNLGAFAGTTLTSSLDFLFFCYFGPRLNCVGIALSRSLGLPGWPFRVTFSSAGMIHITIKKMVFANNRIFANFFQSNLFHPLFLLLLIFWISKRLNSVLISRLTTWDTANKHSSKIVNFETFGFLRKSALPSKGVLTDFSCQNSTILKYLKIKTTWNRNIEPFFLPFIFGLLFCSFHFSGIFNQWPETQNPSLSERTDAKMWIIISSACVL